MLAVLFHPTSYLGIIVFLVLTGCGMPIPEEVAIVVAGVLSAEGHLHPIFALVACLVGAVIGDSVMYAIGYRWGHSLLGSHPRLAKLLHADYQPAIEEAVERHSFKVLLMSRFLVGVRGPVYVSAGAIRMPYRRFLLIDLIGASFVVTTVFSLAFFFGDNVVHWVRDAELTATVAVLVGIAIVGFVLYRRSRARLTQIVMSEHQTNQVDSRSEAAR